MLEFFAGYGPERLLVLLVGAAIAISQGLFPSVSILEWLKVKLNVEDTKMEIIAVAFFMVLAGLASWVTGAISEVNWSLEWLLANFAVFKTLAKVAYEMLKVRNAQ